MHSRRVYSNNFGDAENLPLEQADVVILPVPYEGTVSYGRGTSRGPAAILEASHQLEMYDEEFGGETYKKVSINTAKALPVRDLSVEKMGKYVEAKYDELTKKDKFVVLLGGEHSITPWAVNSLSKKYSDLSILHWDAHADLREDYEGTKFSHACAARRFLDKVDTLVQVGIRSYSVEEADFIQDRGLQKNIISAAHWNNFYQLPMPANL